MHPAHPSFSLYHAGSLAPPLSNTQGGNPTCLLGGVQVNRSLTVLLMALAWIWGLTWYLAHTRALANSCSFLPTPLLLPLLPSAQSSLVTELSQRSWTQDCGLEQNDRLCGCVIRERGGQRTSGLTGTVAEKGSPLVALLLPGPPQ